MREKITLNIVDEEEAAMWPCGPAGSLWRETINHSKAVWVTVSSTVMSIDAAIPTTAFANTTHGWRWWFSWRSNERGRWYPYPAISGVGTSFYAVLLWVLLLGCGRARGGCRLGFKLILAIWSDEIRIMASPDWGVYKLVGEGMGSPDWGVN